MQLSTWVPKKSCNRIKKFIDRLKDGMKPSAAFAAAFPRSLNAVAEIHGSKTATD